MDANVEMDRIASRHATVSDKIRALAAANYERASIARFLGKRYQHVRNVLVQDEIRAKPPAPSPRDGVSDVGAQRPLGDGVKGVYRLEYQADGAIRLPASVEQALGVARGGVVIAEFDGDQLVLLSSATAMKRAQALVSSLLPGSDSLSQSLIADRRRAAQAEAGPETGAETGAKTGHG
jgi:hypothetical protein